MITIDQLLESVDLDFEPRFVTKDLDGAVAVWNKKPYRSDDYWTGDGQLAEYVGYSRLKLAEFDGKDWTECIYEVPQKADYTKWIGKLCRFWDSDKNCFDYEILKEKDNEGVYITDANSWYYYCEPVRPDDDVIYKDAVNELKGAK